MFCNENLPYGANQGKPWDVYDDADTAERKLGESNLEDEADEEFLMHHEDFTDSFYLYFEPDGDGNVYDNSVICYDDEGSIVARLESLESRDLEYARVVVGQEMHISKNKITLGI